MTHISDKTVWITGAGRGIGAQVAVLLAESRNFVLLSDPLPGSLDKLLKSYPENTYFLPIDASCAESTEAAHRELSENTDHIDILILCDEACEYDHSVELPSPMVERVTQTNYLGAVQTIRTALPFLRRSNNRPHIVALSSVAALLPFPSAAAYGASKVALEYFLQSLKVDLQTENIDISIIRTGFIEAQMAFCSDFSAPFTMQANEAAVEVVKAISKRKVFADLPRKISIPLKLLRLIPSLWTRMLAPRLRKPEYL